MLEGLNAQIQVNIDRVLLQALENIVEKSPTIGRLHLSPNDWLVFIYSGRMSDDEREKFKYQLSLLFPKHPHLLLEEGMKILLVGGQVLSDDADHPMQPIIVDADGVNRFQPNHIVSFLLESGPYDLNQLALADFSDKDWRQFAQLIGYSVDGYHDLPYVQGRDNYV